MGKAFGMERKISLCRELTKLHEEVIRTDFAGAIAHFAETPPRGEFVLIVAGKAEKEDAPLTLEDAIALAQSKIESGMSKKDAVKLIAQETGFPKNALYEAVLK
jgi:16S rRNA (cytidine1402-2'-O)-methyltransferase